MATIKINNLSSNGSELLLDSDSYLNELTDDELGMASGGLTPVVIAITIELTAIGFSIYSHYQTQNGGKV